MTFTSYLVCQRPHYVGADRVAAGMKARVPGENQVVFHSGPRLQKLLRRQNHTSLRNSLRYVLEQWPLTSYHYGGGRYSSTCNACVNRFIFLCRHRRQGGATEAADNRWQGRGATCQSLTARIGQWSTHSPPFSYRVRVRTYYRYNTFLVLGRSRAHQKKTT